jgi:hypothetical protein
LLNTTSTNGQQNNTFLDSSTNNFTITRNGTPTQGSITPYWPNGQWSNFFNGSSQLSIPNNAAFELGAGNFSYEAFVYATVATNTFAQGIISYGIAGSTGSSTCTMDISSTGFLQLPYATGAAPTITDPTAFPLNQWVHCVACRSGSTLSLFVNGVRKATTTTSATVGTGGAMVIGGQWFANASTRQLQNGYISNVRVLKGASAYDATLSTLTVPTAPLTPISNTSLLTCQSNRFIDNGTANSGQPFPITANGTPRVQAFQPFSPTASYTTALYGGSGLFNGSTDFLTTPNNAAFVFGSGDFTIEAWVYINSNVEQYFYGRQTTGGIGTSLGINASLKWTGNVSLNGSSNTGIISSASSVPNTWTHIAFTRLSTTITLWINGVSAGTNTVAGALHDPATTVYIGELFPGLNFGFTNGYISNMRVVKGTAVYTGAFTPPTAPVTAITNTSLLLNFTNAGIYDAAAQNDVTTVGDAQASTTITAKWPPTSMKFDGSGDSLTMPLTPATTITSGNFTIEFWLNPSTVASASQAIVGTRENDGAATINWGIFLQSNQLSFQAYSTTGVNMGVLSHQTTLSAGTWYYCALTRNGSTFTLYINSVPSTSTLTSALTIVQSGTTLYVGKFAAATTVGALNGYIQDLRITKGVARTITTPTAAFPTR